MQLKAFLSSKGLSIADAARQTRVKHETFRKWVHRERIPRAAAMRTLTKWTGGLVTANDFCGCDPVEPPVGESHG